MFANSKTPGRFVIVTLYVLSPSLFSLTHVFLAACQPSLILERDERSALSAEGGEEQKPVRARGKVTGGWSRVYLVAQHDYVTAIDLLGPIVETSCSPSRSGYIGQFVGEFTCDFFQLFLIKRHGFKCAGFERFFIILFSLVSPFDLDILSVQ